MLVLDIKALRGEIVAKMEDLVCNEYEEVEDFLIAMVTMKGKNVVKLLCLL